MVKPEKYIGSASPVRQVVLYLRAATGGDSYELD